MQGDPYEILNSLGTKGFFRGQYGLQIYRFSNMRNVLKFEK